MWLLLRASQKLLTMKGLELSLARWARLAAWRRCCAFTGIAAGSGGELNGGRAYVLLSGVMGVAGAEFLAALFSDQAHVAIAALAWQQLVTPNCAFVILAL